MSIRPLGRLKILASDAAKMRGHRLNSFKSLVGPRESREARTRFVKGVRKIRPRGPGTFQENKGKRLLFWTSACRDCGEMVVIKMHSDEKGFEMSGGAVEVQCIGERYTRGLGKWDHGTNPD